jgi:hypothetical protein
MDASSTVSRNLFSDIFGVLHRALRLKLLRFHCFPASISDFLRLRLREITFPVVICTSYQTLASPPRRSADKIVSV